MDYNSLLTILCILFEFLSALGGEINWLGYPAVLDRGAG
jgi:hypothetical protein